jgi:hypothetical protein
MRLQQLLRPHQEALCCLISMRLLIFLNRKTEGFARGRMCHRCRHRLQNPEGGNWSWVCVAAAAIAPYLKPSWYASITKFHQI